MVCLFLTCFHALLNRVPTTSIKACRLPAALATLCVCCLGQSISGQLMLSAQLRMLCRCRLQMLLAALNLLHERLKTQEGSTRRRQAAAGAVTKLIEKFGGSLVDQGASGQTGTPPSAQQGNWQQVQLLLSPDCYMWCGQTH